MGLAGGFVTGVLAVIAGSLMLGLLAAVIVIIAAVLFVLSRGGKA
jgi:hypothetical protein